MNHKRKILLVNDDGIRADGLALLARLASRLGEVTVAAPDSQCSAMSHRITVHGELRVKKVDFPAGGVTAYSVSGTPADCVKVALHYLLSEKPDIVFSGINRGYNAGVDILYSGTVGAAMEALVNGIPAIAFSNEANDVWDAAEKYLLPITEKLLAMPIARNRIWNVNFPGKAPEKIRGILWDRIPSQEEYYHDHYDRKDLPDGSVLLTENGIPARTAPEGTDVRALMDGYISVGQVRNMVLREEK